MPFRFSAMHDVMLLNERLSLKPVNPAGWKGLADNLNALEVPHFDVTGRSCRERADLLIKQYKAQDRANLRKLVNLAISYIPTYMDIYIGL